jgi:tetratricopeptide (TPR) repeat protein
LWREYYNARLAQLEAHSSDAERIYQAISENEHAESKLQAYALCDWGQLLSYYERLGQAGGVEKATSILEKSLNLAALDSHLVRSLFHLARVQGHQRRRKETAQLIEKAKDFCEQAKDAYGLSSAYVEMKRRFASMGLWKDFFTAQARLVDLSCTLPESAAFKNRTLGDSNWGWALAGQLFEGERNAREGLIAIRSLGDLISLANALRDLGLILGYQERYTEASQFFQKAKKLTERIGATFLVGSILGFWGAILTRQGKIIEAMERLTQSKQMKDQMKDPGVVDAWVWLGKLYEIQKELGEAERCYSLGKDYHQYGIYFFSSESLTGLVRVKHAQGDYAAIPPLLAKAEQLAQQYEYNDHLASLRLTQGHLAWEGRGAVAAPNVPVAPTTPGEETAPAQGRETLPLQRYQHALIYALRYNRFLLDEVLSGRPAPRGTPLRPIIPYCLERGEVGRQMLTTLRDWWKTGVNDIGTPRPDTISPIPEGIALLEAEHIAREREPGDGSPQKSVVEQIEGALSPVGNKYYKEQAVVVT